MLYGFCTCVCALIFHVKMFVYLYIQLEGFNIQNCHGVDTLRSHLQRLEIHRGISSMKVRMFSTVDLICKLSSGGIVLWKLP